jgi:transposase
LRRCEPFQRGAEGDRCAKVAAEYVCRKGACEATPLDKIAVKHGVSFFCAYQWYSRLYQQGFRYPKDRFEHLLEAVKEKYGPQAAEEMRTLYDFLRRKETLDGLKTEAAILYYAAKKLGLCYDYVRPRRSSACTPRRWRKT